MTCDRARFRQYAHRSSSLQSSCRHCVPAHIKTASSKLQHSQRGLGAGTKVGYRARRSFRAGAVVRLLIQRLPIDPPIERDSHSQRVPRTAVSSRNVTTYISRWGFGQGRWGGSCWALPMPWLFVPLLGSTIALQDIARTAVDMSRTKQLARISMRQMSGGREEPLEGPSPVFNGSPHQDRPDRESKFSSARDVLQPVESRVPGACSTWVFDFFHSCPPCSDHAGRLLLSFGCALLCRAQAELSLGLFAAALAATAWIGSLDSSFTHRDTCHQPPPASPAA